MAHEQLVCVCVVCVCVVCVPVHTARNLGQEEQEHEQEPPPL